MWCLKVMEPRFNIACSGKNKENPPRAAVTVRGGMWNATMWRTDAGPWPCAACFLQGVTPLPQLFHKGGATVRRIVTANHSPGVPLGVLPPDNTHDSHARLW